MSSYVFTVTGLNTYIKELLDGDAGLAALTVRGEISNYKAYPSGHHYFSLKDEAGSIRCVMFKGDAYRLRFRPANGMKVVAMGRVSVFPRDGQYQLYCTHLAPEGMGDLHAAFEALKAKLAGEGLFEPAHKRPLPEFPRRIALVTSPVGAAVRDMLRILGARWPMAQVCVLPVRVQGEGAAEEIARALDLANEEQLADLIITGRGGGSMEDLWCFNEEIVARAIYRSRIPVISAVGHEPDVTIADYVADLRAATPSNAAELAVPDQNDVYGWLFQTKARLAQLTKRELSVARERLRRYQSARVLTDPRAMVEDKRLLLDHTQERLTAAFSGNLSLLRRRFTEQAAKLDALSPLKVLGRGYAIPQKDGQAVTSVSALKPQDKFTLRLQDGSVPCQVL